MQGTLDIMVQRTGEQGEGNILFVQNNFYYDAFFMKAIRAYLDCITWPTPMTVRGSAEWRVPVRFLQSSGRWGCIPRTCLWTCGLTSDSLDSRLA
jgi:hypothetical protein